MMCLAWILSTIQWNPSNPDTLGTESMHCPDYRGVLISGVGDVLWFIIGEYLVPVVCVHIRGVSPIHAGVGLEEFHCTSISFVYIMYLWSNVYIESLVNIIFTRICPSVWKGS